MTLKIQVHERKNFTTDEVIKHVAACIKAEKVLNSKRFKELFLELKLTNTRGFTNLQIYEKLMSGSDAHNKEEDQDIDVFVEMYYKNNSTVGYTYPNINKTYINRKFFSKYTPAEVACNLVHEYLHKAEFDHHSAKEHTSIPYAVGYLVRDCIEEMELDPGLYEDDENSIEFENPVEPEKDEAPEIKKLYCKRLWYTLWTKKICWYE